MSQTSPEILFIVTEADGGGFIAEAVGQSIVTEADTLDELRHMVRDAVLCHFDPEQRPLAIRLHFIRDEVIAA